jgi:hypothetical protein
MIYLPINAFSSFHKCETQQSVGFAYTRPFQAFGSGSDISDFPNPESFRRYLCKPSADWDRAAFVTNAR